MPRAAGPPVGARAGAPGARALAAALVAGVLAGTAGPLPGQTGREVDAGNFELRVAGERAAVENFAYRSGGTGLQAAARVNFVPGVATAGFATLEARLQTNETLEPAFFEIRYRNGEARTAVGVRAGNRMQLRIRTERGERWQELLVEPGLVVVPEDLAHPYHLVVRALRQHGDELQALRPFRGERERLTVAGRAEDRVPVGDASLPATRYDLEIGGDLHRVWADSAGRILRVEVPSRAWIAVRRSPPGATPRADAGATRPPEEPRRGPVPGAGRPSPSPPKGGER